MISLNLHHSGLQVPLLQNFHANNQYWCKKVVFQCTVYPSLEYFTPACHSSAYLALFQEAFGWITWWSLFDYALLHLYQRLYRISLYYFVVCEVGNSMMYSMSDKLEMHHSSKLSCTCLRCCETRLAHLFIEDSTPAPSASILPILLTDPKGAKGPNQVSQPGEFIHLLTHNYILFWCVFLVILEYFLLCYCPDSDWKNICYCQHVQQAG